MKTTENFSCANLTQNLTATMRNFKRFIALAIICTINMYPALAGPSQAPLFNSTPGAKPNLTLVLDNSGSMAFEFPDDYNITDGCIAGKTQAECNTSFYSARSSGVNPQFYNASFTYLPRVGPDGNALPNEINFVANIGRGNNGSKNFVYDLTPNINYYLSYNLLIPDYIVFSNGQIPNPDSAFVYSGCQKNNCLNFTGDSSLRWLTYSQRDSYITLPPGNKRTDCYNSQYCLASQEFKNIANWYKWYRTRAAAIGTAVGQAMSNYDNQFRVAYTQFNALNYSTKSVSTNQAVVRGMRYFRDDLNNANNQWKSQFYNWIYNITPAGGTQTQAAYWNAATFALAYPSNNDVNIWGDPYNDDPSSNAAEFYNGVTSSFMTCRRSYAVVLSDGAANAGYFNNKTWPGVQGQPTAYGNNNYVGSPGNIFFVRNYSTFYPAIPGSGGAIEYLPDGALGWDSTDPIIKLAARNLYIPANDNLQSTNGFADMTSYWYWVGRLYPFSENEVLPLPAQHNPSFWRNLTTYTIGWNLTPSGDLGAPGGLKAQQITQYRNDWLSGVANPVKPNWPKGDLGAVADYLRVDDFVHAGYTGGGRSYSVYSGNDVRNAFNNLLNNVFGNGNDAGVAVSGNSGDFQNLSNKFSYTTDYNTGDNSGDVKAFRLDADGNYLDKYSGDITPLWSANAKFPSLGNRKIFALSSYDASSPDNSLNKRILVNSNTPLSSLPTDFQTLLNANGLQRSDTSFIKYLLGSDPQSDIYGAVYRSRKTKMGASVNSPPLFVGGRIDMGYATYGSVGGKVDYASYRAQKSSLPPTIFAATNDGLVHVLNAASSDNSGVGLPAGTELGAFMPKGAMAAQINMADTDYRFRYVLDGPLVEQDIYDGKSQIPGGGNPNWRQVVVGTAGRAGNFMYAMESPRKASNRIPDQSNFLWQLDNKTTGYADLANITNNPTAGQLDDGTWVTITGSGQYAGADKQVGLYVVEAMTGKLKSFIPLPAGFGNDDTANGGNRGLGGVVAVRDTNRVVVAAYAGDANGNLWRFDLRSSKFKVSMGRPLFTTAGRKKQPIYAAPTWQTHPGGDGKCVFGSASQCGAIVVVGTGILLETNDLAPTTTKQAIYGIWDKTPIGGDDTLDQVSLTDLVAQTIDPISVKSGSSSEAGKNFYQVSSNTVDWKTKKGWFLNLSVINYPGSLANGERVVGDLSNLGSSVAITSFFPANVNSNVESCVANNAFPNNIYVVDALTGKNKNSFDVNADGTFDPYSILSVPAGGFTRGNVTSVNLIGQPNEGSPDLKPPTGCTNTKGFITGVGGTQKAGDGCSLSKTWRRSWLPVVSPPF